MKIRNIALAYIEHNGKWLVEKGFDNVKNETHYRFLGGGIDFGELSQEAILRELNEEINANDVEVKSLMMVHEDLFHLNGEACHLVEFIYDVKIDAHFYNLEEVEQNENGIIRKAFWMDKELFLSKQLIFHPKVFLEKYM
jgi:ADP-ribose pyrophosphatase YjhB (NUDIX family)